MKIKAVVMAATTVVTLSACKEEASAPTLANITLASLNRSRRLIRFATTYWSLDKPR